MSATNAATVVQQRSTPLAATRAIGQLVHKSGTVPAL
jgi:hypothetical protein